MVGHAFVGLADYDFRKARMISRTGLSVYSRVIDLGFDYGPGVVGPEPEFRSLDSIRGSLLEPQCTGPDPVYGIAMDVARIADLPLLRERMLLFGLVSYTSGRLGKEPPRSQGHVHAIAPHSGWSPPEVFEILEGEAIVYAQQSTDDDPGECIAVTAREGDKVVVPPAWAHAVINADPKRRMVFGAWCDRQYGFIYTGVRRHGGLAWFPVLNAEDKIEWRPNSTYSAKELKVHAARAYPELGLSVDKGLYEQFIENPESFLYVSEPGRKREVWAEFIP
jgi:glucose-6-phosphate isomerase, archaeal